MNALSISALRKVYSNGLVALDGIDLSVDRGDFFALLGPNGAGKSTAIGIISSLVRKSGGQVTVLGHDLDRSPGAVRRSIGLVPQEFNFNGFEPIQEILINSAGYHGVRRGQAVDLARRYLHQLDLWEKRRDQARSLSGGMKRRLMIARALMHQPGLLILDEPTAGVDIEIRRSMWSFLQELNEQQGVTIILTTHYLEEAEAMCRNVAIIDDGRIIEQGRVEELLSKSMVETFVLDLDTPAGSLQLPGFQSRLLSDGERLEVEIPHGTAVSELFDALWQQQIRVKSLRNKSNRLEEFFLRLVEQQKAESGKDV